MHTGCAEAGSAPVAAGGAGYIPGTTMIVTNGVQHTIRSMGYSRAEAIAARFAFEKE